MNYAWDICSAYTIVPVCTYTTPDTAQMQHYNHNGNCVQYTFQNMEVGTHTTTKHSMDHRPKEGPKLEQEMASYLALNCQVCNIWHNLEGLWPHTTNGRSHAFGTCTRYNSCHSKYQTNDAYMSHASFKSRMPICPWACQQWCKHHAKLHKPVSNLWPKQTWHTSLVQSCGTCRLQRTPTLKHTAIRECVLGFLLLCDNCKLSSCTTLTTKPTTHNKHWTTSILRSLSLLRSGSQFMNVGVIHYLLP